MTELTPDERAAKIAKLPVWVRAEFDRLNARLEEAREVARELTSGEADGWADPFSDYPKPVLRTGDTLRFPLDLDGREYIDVKRDGEGVSVRASRAILVRPTVSNALTVELEERY